MKRSLHSLFPALLALAASFVGQAGAAGTPAGTVIQNQASASADGFNPGDPPISALSNLVQAVVSPVCSASVTPDGTTDTPGQSVVLLPSDTATFTYRLTNSGSRPEAQLHFLGPARRLAVMTDGFDRLTPPRLLELTNDEALHRNPLTFQRRLNVLAETERFTDDATIALLGA